MMESLRNFLTGPRLFIVIAACSLPFVFLGTSSLANTTPSSLGSINGENVTQGDFQVATNFAIQKYQNIYGDDFDFSSLSDDLQMELIKQELVIQKTFLSEARSLGFINNHTKRQAKKSIISNPSFWIDNKFDEGVFEAQANASGFTKDEYVDQISLLLASDIYRTAINPYVFSSDEEAKDLAFILEQSVDIDYIKIDSSDLKNSITNSEEELKDYYKSNELSFYSDEVRTFEYFILDSENYKDRVIIPDGYLELAYKDYISANQNKTEIRLAHIMIEKSNYDSPEIAYQQIQDIKNLLLNGKDFSSLAKEYSDDIVTKDTGGDLEYFDSDIFPSEFSDAINGLNLNDTTNIVELDDSFHLLKITEYNEYQIETFDQMKDIFINELIATESLALMKDDYNSIDSMLFENSNLTSVAESLQITNILSATSSVNNFNNAEFDQSIKDYIFSPDSEIGTLMSFDVNDSVFVLSMVEIIPPFLMIFDDVKNQVDNLLSDNKTESKKVLLADEIVEAKNSNTVISFISAYDFISMDTFVDVKRGSSLLPQEVISEIFEINLGDSFTSIAKNGDTYIIDLLSINRPTEDEINDLVIEYKKFSEDRYTNLLTQLISNDTFNAADINLNNLVF
ncbi:SurA N-terminal domain-containing protein [Gammaproteobacteria bacterium]|nr:SurA N-terminal domain-containing protein [Gammaproteobacteria bacterium]